MQIIVFFIVYFVLFKMLKEYKPHHKIVEELDNDPSNPVKSDKWLKAHPEYDNRIIK